MRKVLVIAARDYQAAVRTKAFVVSLVLMPTMMLGGAIMSLLLKNVRDTQDMRVVILDGTGGRVADVLIPAAQQHNRTEVLDHDGRQARPRFLIEKQVPADPSPDGMQRDRFALSERVRVGELLAFVEIDPHIEELRPRSDAYPEVRYHSNRPTYTSFQTWMQPVLDEYLQRARYAREFTGAAPPLAEVRRVLRPAQVASSGLIRKDPRTGALEPAVTEDRVTAVLVPALMMALMFMMVIVGASPLLQSVVEEKTLRIAEVLLGSVTPWQLMLGKLLGTVGVSLTLGLVYIAGGLWAAVHFGFSEHISSAMLGFFLAFQILAVLMYGSIFIAIGAACSDLRETQSMLLPVMFVLVLPMFVLGYVVQYPNSPIATALSFIPTATPMMMTVRQGIPPGIPVWQSLAGMAIVVLTTVLFVWAAGRIFRVGILMQGKGARIGEMLRWVVRG